MNKDDLLNMNREDLINLTSDVLRVLALKMGSENGYEIPDRFKLISQNKSYKWTFDVRINHNFTEEGKIDFVDFCTSERIIEAARRYGNLDLFKS